VLHKLVFAGLKLKNKCDLFHNVCACAYVGEILSIINFFKCKAFSQIFT